MAFRIPNVTALANCNAIADSVDEGAAAGYVELRTGAAPTNCEDASSGTLLATFDLPDPAFGNAADLNPGARATANAIDPATAVAASLAAVAKHWRMFDSDDECKGQGSTTASGGGGDMIIDNMDIAIGQEITITSFTITVPEVAA